MSVPVAALLAACRSTSPGDHPPPPAPSSTGTLSNDCTAWQLAGVTWDCRDLDPCDESAESIERRLACCDCDPLYCAPAATCGDPTTVLPTTPTTGEVVDSCADCHEGIELAHPFRLTTVGCTDCHGGDSAEPALSRSHVPRPPEIGDDANLVADPVAWYRYRTRAGIELLPNYVVDGVEHSALDYLAFVDPGDARVVSEGRGCGGCHEEHGAWLASSPMVGAQGIVSAASYRFGLNGDPGAAGWYADTAADLASRDLTDPTFVYGALGRVGAVDALEERAAAGDATGLDGNPAYAADALTADRDDALRILSATPLSDLALEAVALGCLDCHAATAGPNDGTALFRGGGCSACHMPYAASGRSSSGDPSAPKLQPLDPDALTAPERPHVEVHQIQSRAELVSSPYGPVFVSGIRDTTCMTCHSATNATALQYWGVRVDLRADVANGTQYPAQPVEYSLADELSDGGSWAGYREDQLLDWEDYDGDGRDDTPPDIHAERGLGCIDCHSGSELHGGARTEDGSGGSLLDPQSGYVWSRMEQAVGVTCTTCHGTLEASETVACVTDSGASGSCVVDRNGNTMRNVTRVGDDVWLVSRLDGLAHYVPQIGDLVVDTGRVNPLTGQALYDERASFAMGRVDGLSATGLGPVQADPAAYTVGFSHLDRLECEACHASWTSSCFGCHLELTYGSTDFSRLTGEATVAALTQEEPLFASPLWATLAVSPSGQIGAAGPGSAVFFRYRDRLGALSPTLVTSDRHGIGAVATGSTAPALAHGRVAAHSIRGAPTSTAEGGRQCVACHLNRDQLAAWPDYAELAAALDEGRTADVDYAVLQDAIGRNPGNQRNSPLFVRMMAGLGTGLAQVDADGCPVNPLDATARAGCAPAIWPGVPAYDLDRYVERSGVENVDGVRPLRDATLDLRAGALFPDVTGPLGADLLFLLADPASPVVLDTWDDADGVRHAP